LSSKKDEILFISLVFDFQGFITYFPRKVKPPEKPEKPPEKAEMARSGIAQTRDGRPKGDLHASCILGTAPENVDRNTRRILIEKTKVVYRQIRAVKPA